MPIPPHLFIPPVCGFLYVVAVLCLKRAGEHGAGVWRATFVANWAMALCIAPLALTADARVHALTDYAQPALSALLWVLAQLLLFLAISRGDVSVTTPVMGTKNIFVAMFSSVLLTQSVGPRVWLAAGVGAAAVALLGVRGGGGGRRVGFSIALTALSALTFSLSDTLLQRWVPAWGVAGYLPVMMGLVAVYSLAFVPFFRAGFGSISAAAWRWLAPGALTLAVCNASIVYTISRWGEATVVNILFSSRGLWSVVLVWIVGHWFGNTERHAGTGVFAARLAGAVLMLAAIVLVLR